MQILLFVGQYLVFSKLITKNPKTSKMYLKNSVIKKTSTTTNYPPFPQNNIYTIIDQEKFEIINFEIVISLKKSYSLSISLAILKKKKTIEKELSSPPLLIIQGGVPYA